MKQYIFAITLLVAAVSNLFAFRPKIDYQPEFFEVTDIERLDTCLRVTLAMKNLPNYWVQLDSLENHYLIADGDSTRKYKAIGSENFEFNKHIYMRESGRHEGVLVYEKIPDDVKVIDLLTEGDIDKHGIWGIHLDEEDDTQVPDIINPKTLFTGNVSDKWTGLDPKRYADIPYYKEGGTTHIRGIINNYSPMYDFTTIKLTTYNCVNGNKEVTLGEINPDGTFAFDAKLDYPQFSQIIIGDILWKNIFIMPNDTLDIVTTTLTDFSGNGRSGYTKYFGFKGNLNDATCVNLLTDSLRTRIYTKYGDLSQYYLHSSKDFTEDDVYEKNDTISKLLDDVLEDLPTFMSELPVSTFVKDILAAKAIELLLDVEESNELNYCIKHQPKMSVDSTGLITMEDFKTLDLRRLFESRQKFKDIIYSNPIMVCTDWILPNRWHYGGLFYAYSTAASASISPDIKKRMEEILPDEEFVFNKRSSFEIMNLINADNEKKTGVGNCFAGQLSAVNSLINMISTYAPPTRQSLDRMKELTGNLSSLVEYPTMNNELLKAYATLAEDVALSESPGKSESAHKLLDADKDADVLLDLIKPYRGNLIYIDFWGLGCGPCRSGMIAQKSILEKFANEPFRVLYVAEANNIDGCNRWLEKENIQGEHIYVSTDNWNRLSAYFNFTAIPFGVLIGKNGELLKTHFNLGIYDNSIQEIERHLKEE